MNKTWQDVLGAEKNKAYFQSILQKVAQERQHNTVYPPADAVFNAFRYTNLPQVKVVILGQDPYHNVGQAHGLAFSVLPDVAIPPSLINIYKELSTDISGFHIPQHGCLKKWAEEGVLLLNTVLTVRAHQAHSHKDLGWETFTDTVVEILNRECQHLVFLLWGAHAQKKGAHINPHQHLILKAPHPSPLSAHRGFLGCRHFSQANQYLEENGKKAIDWQV